MQCGAEGGSIVGSSLMGRWNLSSETTIDSSQCTMQAKQIMQWGAEGVIVGSALVKALADAASPQEGLKAMETLAKSIREAI